MFEHAGLIVEELNEGRSVILAVVARVHGSAPRPVGTSMVITEDLRAVGGISGGCVESAVVQRAEELLGSPIAMLETFGYSDSAAFAVGLTCGGSIDVLLTMVDPTLPAEVTRQWYEAAAGRDAALAVDIGANSCGQFLEAGSFGSHYDAVIATNGAGIVATSDGHDALVVGLRSRPPFLIYGAIDIAADLARLAARGGYEVTVCDPRPAFLTPERFPSADHLTRAWPDRHAAAHCSDPRTVVCVLTHDDRFDVALIAEVLRHDVAYLGAMGSRHTHEKRLVALRGAGVTASALERLSSPLGLDLGASTPFDTALSIMAEVIAVRNGRPGHRLREASGPIHTGVSR